MYGFGSVASGHVALHSDLDVLVVRDTEMLSRRLLEVFALPLQIGSQRLFGYIWVPCRHVDKPIIE